MLSQSTARGGLRIAQTVHGLGVGGAQRVIETLTRDLRAAGDDVFVYTPHGGVLEAGLREAGAKIRIEARHVPLFDPGWILRLRRAFRRDGIDLVHLHLFGDTLHGLPAARALGLPVVITLHNELQRHSLLQQKVYPRLLAQATALLACSESVAESLAPWPQLRREVKVVRNGLHAPTATPDARGRLRAAAGLHEDDLLVLFAGRLTEQKDPALLLEAASSSRNPVHLWLAGEGELEAELRGSAAAARLGTRLRFLGPRDDVADLLAAADILAMTSRWEGLPMTLLEAMAARRAILATDVGSVAEATGTDGALLFAPRDGAACTRGLDALATDAARRRALGDAAGKRFEAVFRGEIPSRRHREIYADLVSQEAAA